MTNQEWATIEPRWQVLPNGTCQWGIDILIYILTNCSDVRRSKFHACASGNGSFARRVYSSLQTYGQDRTYVRILHRGGVPLRRLCGQLPPRAGGPVRNSKTILM